MATDDHQTASVDETARRRFEQLWSDGSPQPIEEFLPDRSQQSYLATLEELVLIDMEFSWKAWSGRRSQTAVVGANTIAGPPEVETYINRFAIEQPDIVRRLVLEEIQLRRRFDDAPSGADDYRRRFPEVDLPDTVFEGAIAAQQETAVVAGADTATASPAETLPREFGAYRLLERIGAGGMGVVYRAWQANLDREVALKILRTDQLNSLPPDARQSLIDRFRNESRATARIDHPQIVAVHDVGEVDGVPYYAMQFVAGSSLAEIVRTRLPPPREAARLCRDAAAAVQAAHDYGILHRDLKPHNIIVAEETGTPYVADFGLARLLDEDASPTLTGEVLGTPQFMPPEQAQDSGNATIRSDVYSLGATLYFLLSGRPPFSGRGHMEVLKQVLDSDPDSLRQSNPQLDADLEVICLKCLEKEPPSRYASVAALANDLSDWLEGRPIAARPPGAWERLFRWCRRNPLSSALAGATAVTLVFAIGALWVGFVRVSTANTATAAALAVAESSDQSARAAVDDFFTIVSEDVLLNQPNFQPLRRELLDRALVHYQAFLKTREDDPELRAEIAATHYRVGRILEQLESPAAALPACTQAAAMQKRLHEERPDDVGIQRDLSATLNFYGACLTRLGRLNEALAALQDAQTLRAGLVAQTGIDIEDGVEFRRLAANTEMNIGLVHKHMQQLGPARQHIESSIEVRDGLLESDSAPSWRLIRDQGQAFFNLSNIDVDEGELDSASERLGKAIEHFMRSASLKPEDLRTRARIALCFRLLGECHSQLERLDSAEDAYREAQAWLHEVAVENPRVPRYQEELARLLIMRGQRAFVQHELDAAAPLFQEAAHRLAAVTDGGQATHEAVSDLVQAWTGLASVHHERGEWPQALEWANQALPAAQRLADEFPSNGKHAVQVLDLQAIIDSANAESTGPVRESR